MNDIIKPRKRRGLSSIIGALFFIILMIGTFTALLAAFSYQNELINTQKKLSDHQTAIAHEDFSLAGNTISNKLYVTVNNQGTDNVNIKDLWIIEKNTASKLATPYKINFTNATIAVSTSKNITKGQFTLNPSNLYTIKVVSDLGTIRTIDVPDLSTPVGPQGQQGQACWDLNNNGVGDLVLSPPVVIDSVTYTTEDTDGDGFFTAVDCAGQNGNPGDTIVLDQGLLNKPEIFMMFPSPFGRVGSHVGTWGAIVANPSDNAMVVDKIVITSQPATTQSGQKVFETSCTLGNWKCYGNQVVWKAPTSAGVTIPSRSVQTFLVAGQTMTTGTCDELYGIPVFVNVLTSFGQFGKTNYLSSQECNSNSPVISVYRSDVQDSLTNVKGDKQDILSNQQFTTYVTISDNNTSNSAWLNSGTDLIVNVPKGFVVNSVNGFGHFTIGPIVPNSDTSTQIIATTNETIGKGTVGTSNARSIQLTITAPDLTGQTKPKLYTMFILAEGQASNPDYTDWQIGPIDEVILKVTP